MDNNSLNSHSNDVTDRQECSVQIKAPKKVIHFSDGVIEEFSEDETDNPPTKETEVIDTKSLGWIPWMKYYAWSSGNKALEYCDYVGEGFASFLGITTPKYQLEIDEHMRLQAAEQKLKDESAGWNSNGEVPLVVTQPIVPHDVNRTENLASQ